MSGLGPEQEVVSDIGLLGLKTLIGKCVRAPC